jgi:putative sigma-54 modulation protein
MNVEIRGVHVTVKDEYKDLIDKKLHKLDFVKDHIVDFHLTLSEEHKKIVFDAQMHFNWGVIAHVKESDIDFHTGLDKLFESLSLKARKEKDKIQDHN